jgi:broad specificity phosphatase PhoE
MPVTLFCLRHAETTAPDRFHGSESDVPLSARGLDQAHAIARWFIGQNLQAVISSQLQRAFLTAQIISQAAHCPHFTEPLLHERRMGPLSGMPRDQGWHTYLETRSRWMQGDLHASHPGGESFAQIQDRVLPILDRIVRDFPEQRLAIVAHGVVLRVALCSLLPDLSPAHFESIPIDYTRVFALTWSASQGYTRKPELEPPLDPNSPPW